MATTEVNLTVDAKALLPMLAAIQRMAAWMDTCEDILRMVEWPDIQAEQKTLSMKLAACAQLRHDLEQQAAAAMQQGTRVKPVMPDAPISEEELDRLGIPYQQHVRSLLARIDQLESERAALALHLDRRDAPRTATHTPTPLDRLEDLARDLYGLLHDDAANPLSTKALSVVGQGIVLAAAAIQGVTDCRLFINDDWHTSKAPFYYLIGPTFTYCAACLASDCRHVREEQAHASRRGTCMDEPRPTLILHNQADAQIVPIDPANAIQIVVVLNRHGEPDAATARGIQALANREGYMVEVRTWRRDHHHGQEVYRCLPERTEDADATHG